MTLEPNGLEITTELRNAIRKEALQQTARWTIAGLATLFLFAMLGWWFALEPYLKERIGGVPRGAVIAFDRDDMDVDKCPASWSPFSPARGRAIVGAGLGDGLTNRPFRLSGGAENVKLLEAHIPSHQHDTILGVVSSPWGMASTKSNAVYGTKADTAPTGLTSSYGSVDPTPIATMPPYLALYFCKKD